MRLKFLTNDNRLKMKCLVLFQCMLFLGNYIYAQNTDILYYLPDSVEIKVHEYSLKQQEGAKFYCVLRSVGKDTFNLSVCRYTENEKKNLEKWVYQTKRKVVVNDHNYPLLLDYDYMFSTIKQGRIGVYGDRADRIVRIIPILHCFNIKFTKFYILDEANKPVGFSNKQKKLD